MQEACFQRDLLGLVHGAGFTLDVRVCIFHRINFCWQDIWPRPYIDPTTIKVNV